LDPPAVLRIESRELRPPLTKKKPR